MRLSLFDFVDETMEEFSINQPSYVYVEGVLKQLFTRIVDEPNDTVVNIISRIKSESSLKEKLIRNKFYLDFNTSTEAIEHLTDLIGITIECRFICDEATIFKDLFKSFDTKDGMDYYCIYDENVFLNLKMPQPQLQRNGFTIYRIDGYYVFNGKRINFELQIKALVHTFWSEVEHQVVYKNPNFVAYDSFMKNVLATIRDNLDVVDRQLEIVYKQIIEQTETKKDIGMDANMFKQFVAGSINELVNRKMIENIGFTTDFKKCSSILAQYMYINDFMRSNNPEVKMVEFFEHLNYLSITPFDFSEPLTFEEEYHNDDPFCEIVGQYWQSVINIDYEWHVFFVVLFLMEPGNNIQDLTAFIQVIKQLIITPSWYESKFKHFGEINAQITKDIFNKELAISLVENGKIEMVHEEKLYHIMSIFRQQIDALDRDCKHFEDFFKEKDNYVSKLHHSIGSLF